MRQLVALVSLVKQNKFLTILLSSIAIWVSLLLMYLIANKVSTAFSDSIARIEFIIHFITLICLIVMYKHDRNNLPSREYKIFIYFIGIHFWLLIVDILFYLAAYTNNSFLQKLTLLYFLFYYVPCIIFGLIACIFLFKILIRNIILANGLVKRTIGLFIVTLITLALFLSSIHYSIAAFSFNNMLQIIMIFIEFLLFDISIIGLIYATNLSAFLFLSGIIILINGDFFLTYTYISQTVTLFLLGEFLWLLGLILLMFAVVSIKLNKHYRFSQWFRSDNAIRSRLGFSMFLSSSIGFVLAFVITYLLGLINKHVFVAFPLFVMLYSIIVVLLSVFSARQFETLFKKIEHNVTILSNNQDEIVEDNFSVEEFIFLQRSIIQGFRFKQQQDILRKEYDIIAGIAHDIASPLATMNIALSNFKQEVNYESNLAVLENSMQNVREIADGLLKRHRSLGDKLKLSQEQPINDISTNLARYIILTHTLRTIITTKAREWSNDSKVSLLLEDNVQIGALVWGYLSGLQLSRVISNLLNNAYESRDKSHINIVVSLTSELDRFIITIRDDGCGIASDKIDLVLHGTSSKHTGHGIGLSSAYNYFKKINGTLNIESELTKGTTITLQIPRAPTPAWYIDKVSYQSNSKFILLVNSISQLDLIQPKLQNINQSYIKFSTSNEFNIWYKEHPRLQTNTLIFMHANKDNPNALVEIEAVAKLILKPQYFYLLADNYEDINLQNIAVDYKFKLIPNYLIRDLNFLQVD